VFGGTAVFSYARADLPRDRADLVCDVIRPDGCGRPGDVLERVEVAEVGEESAAEVACAGQGGKQEFSFDDDVFPGAVEVTEAAEFPGQARGAGTGSVAGAATLKVASTVQATYPGKRVLAVTRLFHGGGEVAGLSKGSAQAMVEVPGHRAQFDRAERLAIAAAPASSGYARNAGVPGA
jgi:hypothetical protein